jgi:hypothetical protein
MGTSRSDAKGATQINKTDKSVSTDAVHWGGSALGYTFKPRMVCNAKTRWRTEIEIADIAKCSNPILYGWINYYGKFCKSELNSVWRHFNRILIKWALRKYKRLKGHKTQASRYLQRLSKDKPTLFAHWASGIKGAFA